MSIVDQAFFWLLRWSVISFALLAVAAWFAGAVAERSSDWAAVQATFLALAIVFTLQWVPGLPRWNLGWLASTRAMPISKLAPTLLFLCIAMPAWQNESRRDGWGTKIRQELPQICRQRGDHLQI